jgi:hypothetical protein
LFFAARAKYGSPWLQEAAAGRGAAAAAAQKVARRRMSLDEARKARHGWARSHGARALVKKCKNMETRDIHYIYYMHINIELLYIILSYTFDIRDYI